MNTFPYLSLQPDERRLHTFKQEFCQNFYQSIMNSKRKRGVTVSLKGTGRAAAARNWLDSKELGLREVTKWSECCLELKASIDSAFYCLTVL